MTDPALWTLGLALAAMVVLLAWHLGWRRGFRQGSELADELSQQFVNRMAPLTPKQKLFVAEHTFLDVPEDPR